MSLFLTCGHKFLVSSLPRGGGGGGGKGQALVFNGGYHARVQENRKRVVFKGEACPAWVVFSVSKTTKIKKKGMFFKANEKLEIRVCFYLL